MAMISLRQLLDHAAEHGYGVPAFNINNMEQALAIMEAAKNDLMKREILRLHLLHRVEDVTELVLATELGEELRDGQVERSCDPLDRRDRGHRNRADELRLRAGRAERP